MGPVPIHRQPPTAKVVVKSTSKKMTKPNKKIDAKKKA
jgi:hypothetical protein